MDLTRHTCDTELLWRYAQPCIGDDFRLSRAVPATYGGLRSDRKGGVVTVTCWGAYLYIAFMFYT